MLLDRVPAHSFFCMKYWCINVKEAYLNVCVFMSKDSEDPVRAGVGMDQLDFVGVPEGSQAS
jgi:hypothetical protein